MSDWNKETPEEEKKVTPPVDDTPSVTATPQYDKPAYTAGEWRSDAQPETAAPAQEQPAQAEPVQTEPAQEQPAAQETAAQHQTAQAEPVQKPAQEQPAAQETAAQHQTAQPEEAPKTDWRANPYAGMPHQTAHPQPPQTQWYHAQNGGGATPPPYTGNFVTPPQPPKKRKHTGAIIALSVVGALAVLVLTITVAFSLGRTISSDISNIGSSVSDKKNDNSSTGDNVINNNAPTLNITDWSDNDGGLTATEVIKKNLDSTVVITIYQMKNGNNSAFAFGTASLTQVGSGSGIVMTKDGYIITNWHVVTDTETGKQYDEIDVTLHNGKVYKNAKVIGADQSTDLAVIKVEATDLTPAEFGDSSKMVLGARVIALGNAGGLQWSATQGIISGLARDVYEDTGYSIKCMQTDAAINPGNSGGPLINNQGQVIGINSAKIADTDVEGLGFSIPINEAKTIIDDLTKYGYVKGRVQLGITGYSVNSNGYHGFVIQSINSDSVLKNTNAAVGDLITAIDGTDISGYGDLRSALAKHSVGDEVQLSILRLDNRSGEKTTFTVTCKLAESKN